MDEEKTDSKDKEYQVIREKVLSKKKRGMKRFSRGLFRMMIYAVVFGVVAGAVIVVTGKILIRVLGLENSFRPITVIAEVSPTPPPEVTQPTATGVPASSLVPTVSLVGEPTPIPIGDGGKTPTTPPYTQNPSTSQPDDIVRQYLAMYSQIADISRTAERSIVKVTAIAEAVDWFEEYYETKKNAAGLYVADTGQQMLFLVNLDSIEGATRFEIMFDNGVVVPCTIYAYDTVYHLAILAVNYTQISTLPKEEWPTMAVFNYEEITSGMPVLALGYPNGNADGIEVGMVTGASGRVSVTDDRVAYFTTSITQYAEGDGFIFNLSGKVIGMMSKSLNKGETGVITATMTNGIHGVIDKLLNNIPRLYIGVILEDLDPDAVKRGDVPNGVYVSEVLPASPALAAGLKNGDIITEAARKKITDVKQLYEILSSTNQSLRLVVSREQRGVREESVVYLTPGERTH